MPGLDELTRLLGTPSLHALALTDWSGVERYVGSSLPSDFKMFLDAYGPGVIADELVVFHPQGRTPLLERMHKIHGTWTEARSQHPDDFPNPFHPQPGGLISWNYDYSGDEHFLLPCDHHADSWKIVTMAHVEGCEVVDGSFSDFVIAFMNRLQVMDEAGDIRPAVPSFEPY
ncbi:hypothetical protein [Streptomyces sp. SAI-127]|uniref:hypothetical protein n=1 Tax=Streptomyces sp. SAI-127 TaxID=2940543 RepID=UPI002473A365|nr:hypothetical protein [Streptomyces sp. SAI-127]MDH6493425.1 hypothetical protein [Streptomyces sp. SAI-127]